jgi:hypothetical protein
MNLSGQLAAPRQDEVLEWREQSRVLVCRQQAGGNNFASPLLDNQAMSTSIQVMQYENCHLPFHGQVNFHPSDAI